MHHYANAPSSSWGEEQASNIWLNDFYIRTCCFTVNKVTLKSDPDRGGELQLTAGGTIGWI